jgi:hypothetical protein
MRTSRFGHTATLLRDGRVLVVGGFNLKPNFEFLSGEPVTKAELYDPATRKWSDTGSPASPRYGHTATLLDDGTVLVIGGGTVPYVGPSAEWEVYDPVADHWRVGGRLVVGRWLHTATVLADGRILVAGGGGPGVIPFTIDDCEILDPITATTQRTGTFVNNLETSRGNGRFGCAALRLTDGTVLNAGGFNSSAGLFGGVFGLLTAEQFAPLLGQWSAVPSLPTDHSTSQLFLLEDGTVLYLGGTAPEALRWRPGAPEWTVLSSPLLTHQTLQAVTLADGRIWVAGGADAQGYGGLDWHLTRPGSIAGTESYDALSNTWTLTTPLLEPRAGLTTTLLRDGRVLVAGGSTNATAELYTPSSALHMKWVGSLNAPRLEIQGTVGTHCIVESAPTLSAGAWEPVDARILGSPLESLAVPSPTQGAATRFFRVRQTGGP